MRFLHYIGIFIIGCLLSSCASDNKVRNVSTSIAVLMPLTGANGPVGQKL
ncbi:MAG: hypothetical protein RLZZ59_34, partial [Pseudomonadota bacterium]